MRGARCRFVEVYRSAFALERVDNKSARAVVVDQTERRRESDTFQRLHFFDTTITCIAVVCVAQSSTHMMDAALRVQQCMLFAQKLKNLRSSRGSKQLDPFT
jgi:hypothetical protein